jgi:probable blue pigment (indigoidine) exporter
MKLRWPTTVQRWLELAAVGLFAHATYLGLSYVALQHMSSSLGAIIASTNPLVTAALAPWLLAERLTPRKVVGLVLGFAGVVFIMVARGGLATARPIDAALAFVGVVSFVISTIVFKRIEDREALPVVNVVGFATGTLVLTPIALATEGFPHVALTAGLIASFVWLVVVLSVGSTLLWFWLLTHHEASSVSACYFLTPVFGIALGALILHEALVPRDAFGIACIVAGLYLVTRQQR